MLNLNITKDRISMGILILLVVCGFILRIWHLGDQSLWIDEGFTINAAAAVQSHGYPILESGRIYTNGGPLSVYLSALSMMIFSFDPFDPWSARLPAALFGTFAIAALYYLSRRMFQSESIALFASGALAFSQWSIAWSRQARGYAALSFFVIAALYFLTEYLESKQKRYAWYLAASLILAILSHGSGIPFAVVCSIIVLFSHLREKGYLRGMLKGDRIFYAVVFAASVICAAVGTLMLQKGLQFHVLAYLKYLWRPFPFYICSFSAALAYFSLKRDGEKAVGLLVTAVLSAFTVIAISAQTFQLRYMFLFTPLLILLSVFITKYAVDAVLEDAKKDIKSLIWAVFFILMIYPSSIFLPADRYSLELGSPQPDFKAVFSLIRDMKWPGEVVISPYSHMNKIYLGEKGIWLAMSLTDIDFDPQKVKMDPYMDAPFITNFDELISLAKKKSGYLVLDDMAIMRLSEVHEGVMKENEVFKLMQKFEGADAGGIRIYRF